MSIRILKSASVRPRTIPPAVVTMTFNLVTNKLIQGSIAWREERMLAVLLFAAALAKGGSGGGQTGNTGGGGTQVTEAQALKLSLVFTAIAFVACCTLSYPIANECADVCAGTATCGRGERPQAERSC